MDIETQIHQDLEEREYISADVEFSKKEIDYDGFQAFDVEIKQKNNNNIEINNGNKSNRKLFR